MELLGNVISSGHIQPGQVKLSTIQDFRIPKDAHEIRRWMGLTSYFWKFSRRYAEIAESLTNLIRKDVPFQWGTCQQKAFDTLKQMMTEKPVHLTLFLHGLFLYDFEITGSTKSKKYFMSHELFVLTRCSKKL